jgi:chemotaxis protein methyltransferase CheR
MQRPRLSNQFRHIVFPREESRRQLANLALPDGSPTTAEPAEPELPVEEAVFFSWLFRQAGLDVRHYRSETLHRRLPACLRAVGAASTGEARQLLSQSAALLDEALGAVLVGVTSFFRDSQVFDQLRREILPEIARSRKGISAWSIGCSDGSELYSLAMLIADLGLLERSYLLGSDCRSDAIARARSARYDETAIRTVPSHLRESYFQRHSDCWEVAAALRQAARWRVENVLGEFEMGSWDVICFRNTALYLRPEATSGLWVRLQTALRVGGVLVLGKAERPSGAPRLRSLGPCLYRRQ